MHRNQDQWSNHDADSIPEASGQQPGLLEAVGSVGRELRGVFHDHLLLAALETRRAGESLVSIVVMGVIAACLLLSAWLALAGAIVLVLVQHSLLTASSALMLIFAIHCLLAMLLVAAIRNRSRNLMLPATLGQLKPADSRMSESR